MKRKLTPKEKEACKKGISRREAKIKDLKNELDYLTEFDDFNKKWKKYLDDKAKKEKEAKEKMIQDTKEYLSNQVVSETKALKVEKDQLKNGVEIKPTPPGVN